MNTRLKMYIKSKPTLSDSFRPVRSGLLQRLTGDSAGITSAPPVVHEVLGSSGHPLDVTTRNLMESRFGNDFSRVRVHTDSKAEDSAKAVHAQAYTVGQDIVFGTGRYAPQTGIGQKLLAHELTHVMQQSNKNRPQAELHKNTLDDKYEHEAENVAELVTHGKVTVKPIQEKVNYLQGMPDVDFIVHSLKRDNGRLDNPSDDGAGNVTWPLSFSVTSPLEASADVQVTGSAGDPCTSYQVGFVQTVYIHWLHLYYWGRSRGDGSTVLKYTVPLPIRDGSPGMFWYTSTSHATPSSCNAHVTPMMDDYPTIFNVPKIHTNSLTHQTNYLTGLTRGIHFVTTLIATSPNTTRALRFFYWNYLMNIEFRPNYRSINNKWPFTWKKNTANLGRVHIGADQTVPYFTSATVPYNSSLVPNVVERR